MAQHGRIKGVSARCWLSKLILKVHSHPVTFPNLTWNVNVSYVYFPVLINIRKKDYLKLDLEILCIAGHNILSLCTMQNKLF